MAEQTKEQEQVVVLKTTDNGIKILLGQFEDGPAKGLKYAYPSVESGAQADELFGKDETAGLINAIVKLRIANKVKTNKLPRNVTPQVEAQAFEELAATVNDDIKGLIFSVKEALEYKPGERVPGVRKQIEAELNAALAAFREGTLTPDEGMAIFQKIALLQSRLAKAPTE
jgi:hypothetical protein